ncbi:MAG: hypothetical protein IK080_01150 [Clostridia bacterium]|nr:hypothetical protein [Clostridia bacterium]
MPKVIVTCGKLCGGNGPDVIPNALHFIDVDDGEWRRRIEKRNQDVLAHNCDAYDAVDGLLEKCNAAYEKPDPSEYDCRIKRSARKDSDLTERSGLWRSS